MVNYIIDKYGSLYSFLEKFRKEGEVVIKDLEKLDLPRDFLERIREKFREYVGKLKEKVRGLLKVYSLERDGYKRVKELLMELKKSLQKERVVEKVEVEYKSSPDWYLFFETEDKKKAIKLVQEVFSKVLKKAKGVEGQIIFE